MQKGEQNGDKRKKREKGGVQFKEKTGRKKSLKNTA